MQTAVNWGILGAAKFARQHMAPAIHAAPGGRLAGLATSQAQKAAPFQSFAPDVRVFDSYDALLADPGIHAVYVPLPNHLHVEWALRAMDAGKHVLVEKPLALRASEFDAVIAKRDETGLVAAEAFMIVHHPQWHKARDLVQSGALGQVQRVQANFSYDNRTDTGNIRNRSETGGGAMPDIGVYIIGATRFVTGEEPEEILSADITWENGVDVRTHLTAQFPTFHFSGMVSMRLAPWQEVVLHGTKGVLRLSAPFNANVYGAAEVALQTYEDGPQVTTWRYPADNQYVHQVAAFNRAVWGAEYPCALEFSKGTQAMIDRVFDHAKGAA